MMTPFTPTRGIRSPQLWNDRRVVPITRCVHCRGEHSKEDLNARPYYVAIFDIAYHYPFMDFKVLA